MSKGYTATHMRKLLREHKAPLKKRIEELEKDYNKQWGNTRKAYEEIEHYRKRIEELEGYVKGLREGKPFGRLVGTATIVCQEKRIEELVADKARLSNLVDVVNGQLEGKNKRIEELKQDLINRASARDSFESLWKEDEARAEAAEAQLEKLGDYLVHNFDCKIRATKNRDDCDCGLQDILENKDETM